MNVLFCRQSEKSRNWVERVELCLSLGSVTGARLLPPLAPGIHLRPMIPGDARAVFHKFHFVAAEPCPLMKLFSEASK